MRKAFAIVLCWLGFGLTLQAQDITVLEKIGSVAEVTKHEKGVTLYVRTTRRFR